MFYLFFLILYKAEDAEFISVGWRKVFSLCRYVIDRGSLYIARHFSTFSIKNSCVSYKKEVKNLKVVQKKLKMEIARKVVTYCDLIKWNNYAIIELPVCIYFCVFLINYFCVSGLQHIFEKFNK